MPRPARPWRVFTRADSAHWKVRWGGRGAPAETLSVPRERPRAEAEGEAARRWVARSNSAGPRPAASHLAALSMSELVLQYIAGVEAGYTGQDPRYASRRSTDLTEYVIPRWTSPAEITDAEWKKAKLELHHSRGGPLKWRSIAHLALTLRGFLGWCRDLGLLREVPEIEPPPTEDQRADAATRAAFSAEGKARFLAALLKMGERRAWRIYTFSFESWQRRRTIEKLTRRWVDFGAETITIPAGAIKNKAEIVIDLTPIAAEVLREELAEIDAARKASGAEPLRLDDPIFGRYDFHQAATRKVRKGGKEIEVEDGGIFGRALRLAGLDGHGLTPHHSTRHTAATLAAERPGATVAGLMAQAGWKSASMAEKYLHPNLAAARAVTRSRPVVVRRRRRGSN